MSSLESVRDLGHPFRWVDQHDHKFLTTTLQASDHARLTITHPDTSHAELDWTEIRVVADNPSMEGDYYLRAKLVNGYLREASGYIIRHASREEENPQGELLNGRAVLRLAHEAIAQSIAYQAFKPEHAAFNQAA